MTGIAEIRLLCNDDETTLLAVVLLASECAPVEVLEVEVVEVVEVLELLLAMAVDGKSRDMAGKTAALL